MSEELPEYDVGRPAYKEHPLWNEAMALTHAAYELADRVRPEDPLTARHLRRAALFVRQVLAICDGAETLAPELAGELERAVCFQLGDAGTLVF